MEQNSPTRDLGGTPSPAPGVRFPGEDGGRSLAEMAQRDLDSALQLLADRAQFITGASGAAIALRRSGMNDMQCRASAGSNAPELGALLSTEFGLSGESVRTKRALRCDDAERDARVNREVCRHLGIASVVVMPVVHDDEVMGVFELFSGRANAFGERDISAVKRLSEMVETAVRMAHATQTLPQRLNEEQPVEVEAVPEEETILDVDLLESPAEVVQVATPSTMPAPPAPQAAAPLQVATPTPQVQAPVQVAPPQVVPEVLNPADITSEKQASKKPMFWSAATGETAGQPGPTIDDQTQVPPVMRSLHKCLACGFPVSAGRALCVECEEKKWRGQLKRP